jgi:hypothetical protein
MFEPFEESLIQWQTQYRQDMGDIGLFNGIMPFEGKDTA